MTTLMFKIFDRKTLFDLVDHLSFRDLMYRYSLPHRREDLEAITKQIGEGKCFLVTNESFLYLRYLILNAILNIVQDGNQTVFYYTWLPIDVGGSVNVAAPSYVVVEYADKLDSKTVDFLSNFLDAGTKIILISTKKREELKGVIRSFENSKKCEFVHLSLPPLDLKEFKKYLISSHSITSFDVEKIFTITGNDMDLALLISRALNYNIISRDSLNAENLEDFLNKALDKYFRDQEKRATLEALLNLAINNPIYAVPIETVSKFDAKSLEGFLYQRYFEEYLVLNERIVHTLLKSFHKGIQRSEQKLVETEPAKRFFEEDRAEIEKEKEQPKPVSVIMEGEEGKTFQRC